MKCWLLPLAVVSSLCDSVWAQSLSNPSLEGVPQANVPPLGWGACNQFSTPDTQPGFWRLNLPASDGRTYVSLVTRGNLGPYANTVEAMDTRATSPFVKGKEYKISIDLAFSKDWGHTIDFTDDLLLYDTPAKLRIYGGRQSCDKAEVLWESPPIDHVDWKTYNVTFKPVALDVEYLVFEAEYTGSTPYFGNLLIDNVKVDPCTTASPIQTIGFEKDICLGDSLKLDATTPNGIYLWNTGSQEASITVRETGTYVATVSNGCVTQAFAYVVGVSACQCYVDVPNVFTPNGDGKNDTFKMVGSSEIARFELKVFNRWGALVYNSNSIDPPWSGRINGEPNAGVYFWIVDVQCISNRTIIDNTLKGWVSLVR